METKEIVTGIILFSISAAAFVISYFQFREKGFLFNNAYIWASPKERKTMDKKPHYRQSGIVFALVGLIFLLNAVEVLAASGWLPYVILGIGIFTIIYAVVSSIKIEKSRER